MHSHALRTLLQGVGGAAPEVIPFLNDASTYWWDPVHADSITDTIGETTVSWVKERVNGVYHFQHPNKARQPLQVTGGISFNQASDRAMLPQLPVPFTNGKTGWYIAAALSQAAAAQCDILDISRASSTALSRGQFYIGSSRLPSVKFAANDGAAPVFLGTAPAITLGVKFAFEAQLDTVADTFTIWINGVSATLSNVADAGPWSSFASSNPLAFVLGNQPSGSNSLNGTLFDIKFYDGVPSGAARASMSAHTLLKAA